MNEQPYTRLTRRQTVNRAPPQDLVTVQLSFCRPVLQCPGARQTASRVQRGPRVVRTKPASADRFPASDALSDPRHLARLGTHSMGSAAQATYRPQPPGI